jgi:hypothetical protein
VASADLPYPITPQKWHFRQSIEYSLTANRAVLDVASRHREQFLFNIFLMGKRSIERGSQDTWTNYPSRIERIQSAISRERADGGGSASPVMSVGGFATPAPAKFYEMLRDPKLRDARGYILPSDQPDFPTAIKFANTLMKTGIAVHRATADFTVAGTKYPAGSLVVKAAQAFRPHVLDMFEPQDHPNDFAYPGGPPIPPYDSAGWTLAYQMGVKFDRILDGFDGPFEKLATFIKPQSAITGPANPAGYLLSAAQNDAFTVVATTCSASHERPRVPRPGRSSSRPGRRRRTCCRRRPPSSASR